MDEERQVCGFVEIEDPKERKGTEEIKRKYDPNVRKKRKEARMEEKRREYIILCLRLAGPGQNINKIS